MKDFSKLEKEINGRAFRRGAEILITRSGIFIDGKPFDRKVKSFSFDAHESLNIVTFCCYVETATGDFLLNEQGNELLTEEILYVWERSK